jgi:hypothetical protein
MVLVIANLCKNKRNNTFKWKHILNKELKLVYEEKNIKAKIEF